MYVCMYVYDETGVSPGLYSGVNERFTQASAVATRSQLPKCASLRDAGFAALCGGAGMWLLLARVWLCEDLPDESQQHAQMIGPVIW